METETTTIEGKKKKNSWMCHVLPLQWQARKTTHTTHGNRYTDGNPFVHRKPNTSGNSWTRPFGKSVNATIKYVMGFSCLQSVLDTSFNVLRKKNRHMISRCHLYRREVVSICWPCRLPQPSELYASTPKSCILFIDHHITALCVAFCVWYGHTMGANDNFLIYVIWLQSIHQQHFVPTLRDIWTLQRWKLLPAFAHMYQFCASTENAIEERDGRKQIKELSFL